MDILVFNCGSSSQGFTVFRTDNNNPEIPIFGKARNVATKTKASAVLEWNMDGIPGQKSCDLSSHRLAAKEIISLLQENNFHIDAIAHRFVNGGDLFQKAVKIDNDVMEQLRASLCLAPIHNPNSYSVIEFCLETLPGIPQFAVFDTAFHSKMSRDFTAYAIPQKDALANGWRKIGFHGLSYQYVSHRAAELLGKPYDQIKLVMCHLGTGGSSVCAFRDGHSIDTSMGYSPTSGLAMSTRSGDLDPEIVLELMRKGMDPEEISDYLNKNSGLIGLSGYSSNLGEIIEAAENGNKDCQLAFHVYVNRLRSYIGAFLFLLNGADALIFTDDAGVKFAKMREAVCRDSEFFGLKLDAKKNSAYDMNNESCISTADSRISIWVIPTNEEQVIYNETVNLIRS